MKKSWIILLGLIINIFSIYLVFGETIDINYPQQVIVGNEFNINLILNNFSQDVYDIKVEILNGTHNIAKIWNGESWQSTNNYVNDIINTSEINSYLFRINISENYNGLNNLTIKVRDSKSVIKSFSGYNINITPKAYNPQQNNPQTPVQNNTSNPKASISIDWNDDEIINGDEFDIEVNAKNLKNQKYNFKIWIKDDEENIISDRYGKDSSEKEVWKSGNYYIYNLFEGPGNKTETIKLKIRKGFSDFSGDAEICFKLENQKCEAIEVLKKEAVVNKNNTEKIKIISKASESTNSISGDVIKLGSSKSKETITNNQKNTDSNTVYESKNEKIKIYAIISFAVLCLGLVILVLFNKLN